MAKTAGYFRFVTANVCLINLRMMANIILFLLDKKRDYRAFCHLV